MTRPARRPVLAHVGARLRELRLGRGWTLVDAAAEAQCSREGLRSWEMGRRDPGLDAVAHLAGVYGVGVGDLFPGALVGEGMYRAAAVRYREALDALGRYRGPCGLCGHPDGRHRQADSIAGALTAGDGALAVAADYLRDDPDAAAVLAVLQVTVAVLAADRRFHDLPAARAADIDREVWAATVREWEMSRAVGAGH